MFLLATKITAIAVIYYNLVMNINKTLAVDHQCLLFLSFAESPKMDSFQVLSRSCFRTFWLN